MEKEFLKEQQYLNAKKRVKEIKGFYSHFLIYVLINIFISGIIIIGLTYNDNSSLLETLTNFGVYSTWLFWGIGIFFHWLSVFGFKNLLGSSWEEKKIRELMKKEDERKKIYDQLYDVKSLEVYKENFKLTEKAISYDDFVKLASEK